MSELGIDIIIPVWNEAAMTVQCLRSIRRHTPKTYRVILVDNGSDQEEFEQVDAELLKIPHHLLMRNTENVGFVKATNQGLDVASAPFVVLMNNDTEAVGGWVWKLLEPFDRPEVAAVGPLTTTPHSWQGRYGQAPGWHVLPRTAMLAFFCTMIRTRVLREVGPLDEDFGVGFGDDDDYSARIHEAGHRLALRTDLVIPHHHRTTFRTRWSDDEIVAMQHEAIALFREKRMARLGSGPVVPSAEPTVTCGSCESVWRMCDLRRGESKSWICGSCGGSIG